MGAGPFYDYLNKQRFIERQNIALELKDEFEIAFVNNSFYNLRTLFIKAFEITKGGLDDEKELRFNKVIEDLKRI